MSLEHAILGFLSYKPLSGYDLKAVFDMTVQHFWPADQSQIYRTLSKLAEEGLAEIEVIEQDERPDRKVYHITEGGREELHRWLISPLPNRQRRVHELVQVFFAGQVSDEDALAMFRRMAEDTEAVLPRLRGIPEENKGKPNAEGHPPRDAFFFNLTLEYGIRMTEASLTWMQEVISRIERGEHTKGATK